MKNLIPYIFLLALLSTTSNVVAASNDDLRVNQLRGISITLTPENSNYDLSKISQWGANLVRLTIFANPKAKQYGEYYLPNSLTINPDAFAYLDRFLAMAEANDLKVIIDVHTYPGVGGEIWSDYKYWDALTRLCEFMAKRYKGNHALVGYAPINEPNLLIRHGSIIDNGQMRLGVWKFPVKWRNTPRDYFGLVEKIGKTINRIDPSKLVIVAGVGFYGSPVNYQWMEKVDVQNAVYAFNMYMPQKFGDSGKAGRAIVEYDRDKQYPQIIKAMDHVKAFSTKNNVKVFVSAFGLPYHTEGMGAEQWMEDVLSYFEANKWSWAYWTYSLPFRDPEVVGIKNGVVTRNPETERLRVLKKYWALNHGK